MGLLGSGAMVIWYDHADKAAHDEWHSHQHLMERVGIPGFLRGRRGAAVSGNPMYFVLYEVQDLTVLTSQAYLERLNNPTAWTQKVMPSFRNMNRTFCRVTGSFGTGIGAQILTIRLSPAPDHADLLRHWLLSTALPDLVQQPGIVTACLLEGDTTSSRVETAEIRLRQRADEVVDWVVLVDGYELEAVRSASAGLLSPASLMEHGASDNPFSDLYHLGHIVIDGEITAAV